MKCCDEERATPYCAACGKKLGQPNSIIGLLHYLRKLETERRKLYEQELNSIASNSTVTGTQDERRIKAEKYPVVSKQKNLMEKWKRWADVIEALINNDYAKIHADYLEENSMTEAATLLRGVFNA